MTNMKQFTEALKRLEDAGPIADSNFYHEIEELRRRGMAKTSEAAEKMELAIQNECGEDVRKALQSMERGQLWANVGRSTRYKVARVFSSAEENLNFVKREMFHQRESNEDTQKIWQRLKNMARFVVDLNIILTDPDFESSTEADEKIRKDSIQYLGKRTLEFHNNIVEIAMDVLVTAGREYACNHTAEGNNWLEFATSMHDDFRDSFRDSRGQNFYKVVETLSNTRLDIEKNWKEVKLEKGFQQADATQWNDLWSWFKKQRNNDKEMEMKTLIISMMKMEEHRLKKEAKEKADPAILLQAEEKYLNFFELIVHEDLRNLCKQKLQKWEVQTAAQKIHGTVIENLKNLFEERKFDELRLLCSKADEDVQNDFLKEVCSTLGKKIREMMREMSSGEKVEEQVSDVMGVLGGMQELLPRSSEYSKFATAWNDYKSALSTRFTDLHRILADVMRNDRSIPPDSLLLVSCEFYQLSKGMLLIDQMVKPMIRDIVKQYYFHAHRLRGEVVKNINEHNIEALRIVICHQVKLLNAMSQVSHFKSACDIRSHDAVDLAFEDALLLLNDYQKELQKEVATARQCADVELFHIFFLRSKELDELLRDLYQENSKSGKEPSFGTSARGKEEREEQPDYVKEAEKNIQQAERLWDDEQFQLCAGI